jgi:hypothetical protein
VLEYRVTVGVNRLGARSIPCRRSYRRWR